MAAEVTAPEAADVQDRIDRARAALEAAEVELTAAIAARDCRIALRPTEAGSSILKQVVVRDVETFHAKRLNDGWWLSCYLAGTDDERITFNLSAAGGGFVEARVGELPYNDEGDHPEITYEAEDQ
jgi:hypothetical protein